MPTCEELAGLAAGPSAMGEDAAQDRHMFVVCDGQACHDAGAHGLLGLLENECPHHGRTEDVHISSSRCIGRCAMAPAVVEDGHVLGWVSLRRLKVELMRLGLMLPAV